MGICPVPPLGVIKLDVYLNFCFFSLFSEVEILVIPVRKGVVCLYSRKISIVPAIRKL